MKQSQDNGLILLLAGAAGAAAFWAWLRSRAPVAAAAPSGQPMQAAVDELALAEELARRQAELARRPVADVAAIYEPTQRSFDLTTPGTHVIVSGVGGYRIAVHEFSLYNPTAQDLDIRDGSASILPLPTFPAQAGYQLSHQDTPHWVLGYGNSLLIVNSAGRFTGFVKYRMLERWGS